MTRNELEAMASALEQASDDYRVLRKLKEEDFVPSPGVGDERIAIILDSETTGLSMHGGDEVVQLSMLKATYANDRLTGISSEIFDQLREPSISIPPAATAIHGLTDDICKGRMIDPTEIDNYVAPASIVISFNAAFDRPMVEKHWPEVFTRKPWACAMTEIDWKGEGFEGTKLSHLLTCIGAFYDKHNALWDCRAVAALLRRKLPSGADPMSQLLANARRSTMRCWAEGASFDKKEGLRMRGYRWNNGDDGRLRAWYRDVCEDSHAAEIAYLRDVILGPHAKPPVTGITAYDRFSHRC